VSVALSVAMSRSVPRTYDDDPWVSTSTHLRASPQLVEPLGTSALDEEELEIEEKDALTDLALTPPPRTRLTPGLIALIVVAVIVVLVAIGLLIYYLVRNVQLTNANNGPPIVATLGESCASLPCVTPLICQQGICVGSLHGPCFGNSTCQTGEVCSGGQCFAGLFQRCQFNEDCAPGLTCSLSTCIAIGP
jgi:hypothetical protein